MPRIGAAIVVLIASTLGACALAAPAWSDHAQHSLRSPVTDENFYFVMADRFANGDASNDRGGISGGPR